jgi:hypothetical protein
MPGKISRNDPCPCGSGKKYKKCCINKDFDWVETDDGNVGRSVHLSDETIDVLQELRQSQIEKFGYLPDRVFEGAPPLEHIEHFTIEAMKKAAVEPALIFAYEKTGGLLLNARNEKLVPDSDIEEWEAAIDEYEKSTGRKASRRRLSEDDIHGVMQHLPGKQPSQGFVTGLPFPPPFEKEKWGEGTLRSIIEVPEIAAYFEKCLSDVITSARSEAYLKMFCVMASGKEIKGSPAAIQKLITDAMNRTFTKEELEEALERVYESCQPQGAMPSSPAVFEFTGFIGNFIETYAENSGFQDYLSDAIGQVRTLTLLAFAAAVNAEFKLQPDIWA